MWHTWPASRGGGRSSDLPITRGPPGANEPATFHGSETRVMEPELRSGGAEQGASLDWADSTDLPVEEVRDVFLTFSKAIRAHRLYDAGNPVYRRFLANLRESFERFWEARDELQILIQEDRLLWMGEEVYRNASRSESLSFALYRDGIRDLTFMRGVEQEELEKFLGALQRAKGERGEGEELVTLLWDLDFKLLSYTAIDVGLEGIEVPSSGEGNPTGDPSLAMAMGELRSEAQAAETQDELAEGEREAGGGMPGVVRKEDFNPTLYALAEDERHRLLADLQAEMERDIRSDVLTALLDTLELQSSPERQVEVLGILRTLLPALLSQGGMAAAALIVGGIRALREGEDRLAPEAENLAGELIEDLSSPHAVEELIRALEDGGLVPEGAELTELLRSLGPRALEPLIRGAEGAATERARTVLREALRGIAQTNREALLALFESPDPTVVTGAVHLVAAFAMEEAAGKLAALLDRGGSEVPMAVVQAAAQIRSPVLAGALLRLLRHKDRDLRVAAVRVVGRSGYPLAAKELRAILEGKGLRTADVTEKVAFFEAYGLLGGDDAAAFLGELLNGKGFLGRREPSEIRAAAALGLGKGASPGAKAALERARSDDDPVVRSAVGRALRGEAASDE
jgi:hypothetical protein